jgi:hypothetical protein
MWLNQNHIAISCSRQLSDCYLKCLHFTFVFMTLNLYFRLHSHSCTKPLGPAPLFVNHSNSQHHFATTSPPSAQLRKATGWAPHHFLPPAHMAKITLLTQALIKRKCIYLIELWLWTDNNETKPSLVNNLFITANYTCCVLRMLWRQWLQYQWTFYKTLQYALIWVMVN